MSERKAQQSLENLKKALTRLEEALQEKDTNSLYIDGTIQRFEFTFELFWKTVKRLLQMEGIETKTPRETLKHAYSVKWLKNEQAWLQMLRDRNETSHLYDEAKAKQIYENIKGYFPELNDTFIDLSEKYGDSGSDDES
ncbi:HI0074 family nucleotidyltransferase substrate-binding subunit [Fredinandcohnia quinoae]|uniref:Nucleotidyltransferase substrate binding protein n=1 Tax=Fredinandcohnia quinoae TaxID=2918902 RepID=A0AAW5DUH7_9BACI|nr:HI0074 family nucleotidyltransferase substrate-binding subunit [Fredinandcohnia sp. SECRCQ15]MCH1624285.1 nucleotidyltransferase substrate binding protein [Fredinandcohnia sp. SECRCQ15]